MRTSPYGIKIKNFQAGSLYQCNIGVRQNYDYTRAMFTNNLFLYYLIDNGLKIENGWTRDIICIQFDYGSRSYEEEIEHLDKMIANPKYDEEKINFFKSLKVQAEINQHLFSKKSADEIRDLFYKNGVEIRHDVRSKKGDTVKEEYVHYRMLYRSTGKAKQGECMFIRDELYDKAIKFLRMGIELSDENAPIVEISAYSSLIASSIVGTININPKHILVLKDVDSLFKTNVVSIETNERKECIAVSKNNYTLKNTMFDGQGLIDESIFPTWGEGYVLLRHHMCKMACFKTRIQKFFQDYYGNEYSTATIKDMWGNEHLVKDIKLITTDNAMKWTKFGITYDYWCDRVFENGCKFGIVKTAHKSKLGEVQRMSYQMINSLDVDIMPNVVAKSLHYIEQLKGNDNIFIDYLKANANFSNDYEALIALYDQNHEFVRSEYFRARRYEIIDAYVNQFKFGKVIQNADNLVFVGSPYAMLLHAVGEDVESDPTFTCEDGAIQCFTERFNDDEYLACFRSPHNSKNNISYLHNVYSEEYFKYFDFGKQILVLNVLHTDVQDRMNGCDFDSDSGYVTNQSDIVACAKRCYAEYPTIVNNIPKDKNHYDNTIENFALIDNKLSHAQMAIGSSSNLAQIAQTYMYNFSDQKYKDYVCILSCLAQCAIDNAKRTFDIDLVNEIDRIKKDMNIDENAYPIFWKHIKDVRIKSSDKKFKTEKINKDLQCPMNYLMTVSIPTVRSSQSTLPMSCFFKKFELEQDRRKSMKVENFIEQYSLDVYNEYMGSECEDGDELMLLMRDDFEELIEDIKTIYISYSYVGLMAWLIDRAFLISSGIKCNKNTINRKTNINKVVLMRVLYNINPSNFLKIFSK